MPTPIKRIAIIGAGATGLATAKYLLAEKCFNKIDIFEQRDRAGGVWIITPPTNTKHIPIPQTDPTYGTAPEKLLKTKRGKGDLSIKNESLEFESPLYDYLETNIPKAMMEYSDFPFPEDYPLFPGHAQVEAYLEQYAKPVEHLIRFRTQVIDIKLLSSQSRIQELWAVTINDLATDEVQTHEYDAVVVANGHYTVPAIPSIKGISEWNKTYLGAIIHSKAYRRPEDYKGQKVVVVGNAASGFDITLQLAKAVTLPITISSRSSNELVAGMKAPDWLHNESQIAEFLPPESGHRAIRFASGTVMTDIDTIIFATGYYYCFPFLNDRSFELEASHTGPADSPGARTPDSVGDPASDPGPYKDTGKVESSLDLITTGHSVHNIYKDFLHIQHPTLALPVLTLRVLPFPLAENQAAVLSRLWSGRLSIPSENEMLTWLSEHKTNLESRSRYVPDGPESGKGLHALKPPEDVLQMCDFYNWAASAKVDPRLENEGIGKLGRRYQEWHLWLRSTFLEIKMAFNSMGEDRFHATKLEDLPKKIDFEEWKEKTPEEERIQMMKKAGLII